MIGKLLLNDIMRGYNHNKRRLTNARSLSQRSYESPIDQLLHPLLAIKQCKQYSFVRVSAGTSTKRTTSAAPASSSSSSSQEPCNRGRLHARLLNSKVVVLQRCLFFAARRTTVAIRSFSTSDIDLGFPNYFYYYFIN